jgi:signal recognition particle subunit SRP19
MVRTRADRHILWPCYFDIGLSRAEGRRVPRSLAVQNPTAQEIYDVAIALGLKAALHEGRGHPSRWWEHEGRVAVEKGQAKAELMGNIAQRLCADRKAAAPGKNQS